MTSTFSIGCDLLRVSRIASIYQRKGEAFVWRYFTAEEVATCGRAGTATYFASLAARFAAKEALLKALGTGLSRGMRWRDVEVLRKKNGEPYYRLSGGVLARYQERGACELALSLSHEGDYALAFCQLRLPTEGKEK